MRILISFISTILLVSSQFNERKTEINSEQSTDSIPQITYKYRISENIVIESATAIPYFNVDSIDAYSYYGDGGKYTYIRDNDGRLFFCTIVAEQRPAILKEDIYLDYDSAKYRYFVFDDTEISNENKNRIFVGVILSQTEQTKVQEFLSTFKGVITPQMWTPNSFSLNGFRPIKQVQHNKNGDYSIVVNDKLGNDSIITVEPLKRERFGRNQATQWQTEQFDD
jgi:hypothetical protein